jgi:hypothetical protein
MQCNRGGVVIPDLRGQIWVTVLGKFDQLFSDSQPPVAAVDRLGHECAVVGLPDQEVAGALPSMARNEYSDGLLCRRRYLIET